MQFFYINVLYKFNRIRISRETTVRLIIPNVLLAFECAYYVLIADSKRPR